MKTKRRSVQAFTLIELLIVMGIIGLLVALLIPAIGTSRRAAARTRARTEVTSFASAMRAFRTDYGRFPLQNSSTDRLYSNAEYGNLVNSLRGNNNTDNPRRNAYMDVADISIQNGELRDPWGVRYQVAADWSGDNAITTQAMDNHPALSGRSVAVWSWGPDSSRAERDQHIRSWTN